MTPIMIAQAPTRTLPMVWRLASFFAITRLRCSSSVASGFVADFESDVGGIFSKKIIIEHQAPNETVPAPSGHKRRWRNESTARSAGAAESLLLLVVGRRRR